MKIGEITLAAAEASTTPTKRKEKSLPLSNSRVSTPEVALDSGAAAEASGMTLSVEREPSLLGRRGDCRAIPCTSGGGGAAAAASPPSHPQLRKRRNQDLQQPAIAQAVGKGQIDNAKRPTSGAREGVHRDALKRSARVPPCTPWGFGHAAALARNAPRLQMHPRARLGPRHRTARAVSALPERRWRLGRKARRPPGRTRAKHGCACRSGQARLT